MERLPLHMLISGAEESLGILRAGAMEGLQQEIHKPVVHRSRPGDPSRDGCLLVVGPSALDQAARRRRKRSCAFLQNLITNRVRFIAFSDHLLPPERWRSFLEDRHIPWCVSRYDAYLLESRLQGLIREKMDGVKTVHAGLVEINGWGVLLTGEAGSGKTRLALELLRRGHGWIADDAVVLRKRKADVLVGHAHGRIKGLLHLRGEGIHHVSGYGSSLSLPEEAVVKLVIDGSPRAAAGALMPAETFNEQVIMGVAIPYVKRRLGIQGDIRASAQDILRIVYQRQSAEACK